MSLWDMLRRAWRKFELFAHAMDYDQHSDNTARIENLERLQQSSSAALADAEKRVAALSGDVAALSEQVPLRAQSTS